MRVVSSESKMSLLQLHQANPARYPYLLQSTAHDASDVHLNNPNNSQYDILFACPGQRLILDSNFKLYLDDKECAHNDFLDEFNRLWEMERQPRKIQNTETRLPFTGGWFVFLSYELVSQIEPGLGRLPAEKNLPVAIAIRCHAAVIFDNKTKKKFIVAEETFSETVLEDIKNDLQGSNVQNNNSNNIIINKNKLTEENENIYLNNISKVKNFITEGDVFQVNLSRKWQYDLQQTDAAKIYQKLCGTNPGPFAGFAKLPNNTSLVSSSPERLVYKHGNKVSTRPIAGTFPRNKNKELDRRLPKDLVMHHKERAEHIMLIDLERNDLGRICQPGSIKVSEMMSVESYEHVHHIVSQVEGEVEDNITPADIIRAVFPGGTITGCPKIRCMEIIRELENAPRGAYTGSMGYINTNGDMDLNILIRTMVVENNKISFRAGSGLVADSVPRRELEETRAKAKGMINALD